MKKIAQPLNVLRKSLAIVFIISFFILSAGAQNIGISFPTAKVNAPDIRNDNTSLSIYPNPAADESKIIFYSSKYNVPYQVRIVNSAGVQLKNIKGTAIQGQNTIRIHVGNYPSGVYYVQLLTPESRETLKLLKQPL
jgi:Secretion system C-terminal sorting domain